MQEGGNNFAKNFDDLMNIEVGFDSTFPFLRFILIQVYV